MVGKSQNFEFTCVEEKEKSFACDKLLHNKKREDLQRLEDLKNLLEYDDSEKVNNKKDKKKKKKKKKMYLKDVRAQQVLEEGPDYIEEDEKTYAERLEESRRALTDDLEAESDEDGDDLLRVAAEKDENDVEVVDQELNKKYDECIEDPFLNDFLKNKRWEEKDVKSSIVDEAVLLEELEEDEKAVEMQEDYETNLAMGQSRKVEGSVRKVNKARKAQRKSKEERKKLAKIEKKEELKRHKNMKKKEIMEEKMKKVRSVAGFKDGEECPFDAKDFDDEFDPEKYDKRMEAKFGAKYYGAEDSYFNCDEDDCSGDDDEEEELKNEEKGKRKRKRKTSLVQRAKEEAEVEEYYKLDYEDTIGDLKTRFKYAKVEPNKYELETEEILALNDTELNQYVPLKKMAPYVEKDWEVNKYKLKEQKHKIKELLQGKHDEMKRKKKSEIKPTKKPKVEDEVAESKLSKKAKRRRRQAEKKLPLNRMTAYGKVVKP